MFSRRAKDKCPGQYPRNLISLLHFYFPYINCTELTNQLICRLNIVGFRNQAGKPAALG